MDAILSELKANGLRLAMSSERGWYVRRFVNGEVRSFWVTDKG